MRLYKQRLESCDHKPWNASGLWKLQEARDRLSSKAPRRNQHANTLTRAQRDRFQTPGFQNCKRINVCFRPLSSWPRVAAATGNLYGMTCKSKILHAWPDWLSCSQNQVRPHTEGVPGEPAKCQPAGVYLQGGTVPLRGR